VIVNIIKVKWLTERKNFIKHMKSIRNGKLTFTKKWVAIILIVALIDIQFSYILCYLGRSEAAITLSITIVTEIVGVMTGYFVKSYNETKQEKLQECRQKELLEPIGSLNDTGNPVG